MNISLKIKAPKEKAVRLTDTINYAEVYQFTTENFSHPRPLLETVVMEIADGLKEKFPAVIEATIELIKLQPPIMGFTGAVGVRFNKKYKV